MSRKEHAQNRCLAYSIRTCFNSANLCDSLPGHVLPRDREALLGGKIARTHHRAEVNESACGDTGLKREQDEKRIAWKYERRFADAEKSSAGGLSWEISPGDIRGPIHTAGTAVNRGTANNFLFAQGRHPECATK